MNMTTKICYMSDCWNQITVELLIAEDGNPIHCDYICRSCYIDNLIKEQERGKYELQRKSSIGGYNPI